MFENTEIKKILLPYDNTNPVIYDNDSPEDVYTDEYLMALAGAGEIKLKGLITTNSYASSIRKSEISYDWDVDGREQIVGKARRSGMKNIPDAMRGPATDIVRPVSGLIEDTVPLGSPGAQLIIKEARLASTDKPLVIIMGGQATVVADAYLQDNAIAENIVLSWLDGGDPFGYNGLVDPWSTYIVMSKFKVAHFGFVCNQSAPEVPKQRLKELPHTEMREWMIEKELPHASLPGERDLDGHPAISLMRPDYITGIKRKSVSGCDDYNGMPELVDDEDGNIYIVTKADRNLATEEWWRALKNPAAYDGNPQAPVSTPYNGKTFAVPGIIDAEEFDYGGEGVSYHCRGMKNESQFHQHLVCTTFRTTDHFKFDYCSDIRGEYVIQSIEAGEWMNYTVDVKKAGHYRIEVRATTQLPGGAILHLEFKGQNKTGTVKIPAEGGWKRWLRTVKTREVELEAGRQIMRLVCDNGYFTLNYVELISLD